MAVSLHAPAKPRACAHCKGPIDGLPLVRGGVRLHPACARDYAPTPREATEFVPSYERKDVWGKGSAMARYAAKWRATREGVPSVADPEAPEAESAPATPAEASARVRGRRRISTATTDNLKGLTPRVLVTRKRRQERSPDPENFRPVPGIPHLWCAADGRCERRQNGYAGGRLLISGSADRPGLVRFTVDGESRLLHRAELVRAAWGSEAAGALALPETGGAA